MKDELRQIDNRTKNLLMVQKPLHPSGDIDYVCQGKKEEEDSSSLNIVWMRP